MSNSCLGPRAKHILETSADYVSQNEEIFKAVSPVRQQNGTVTERKWRWTRSALDPPQAMGGAGKAVAFEALSSTLQRKSPHRVSSVWSEKRPEMRRGRGLWV